MTRLCTVVASIVALLCAAPPVAAFKPGPPAKKVRYLDGKTRAMLVITNDGWRPKTYEVRVGSKRYRWPKAPSLPATAKVSSRAGRVVLLGGYGDGCSDLGKISIYNLRGKRLAHFDLAKRIAGLKNVSRSYTRICCPCRWLHKIKLSSDGDTLDVNICNAHQVRIALKRAKLQVVK